MGPSPCYTDDASSERLNVGDDVSEFLDGHDPSSDAELQPRLRLRQLHARFRPCRGDGNGDDVDSARADAGATTVPLLEWLLQPHLQDRPRQPVCDYCVASHDYQCSNDRGGPDAARPTRSASASATCRGGDRVARRTR